MKKSMFIAMALLLSMASLAQHDDPTPQKKFLLSYTMGFGTPVGSFASTSAKDIGLANGGFSVELTMSRTIHEGFGIGADLFHTNFGVNTDGIGMMGSDLDHWKVWGLTVGPDLHGKLADKFFLDVRMHAGIARVNPPVLSFENRSTQDVWNNAFTLRPGADLRLFVNARTYLRLSMDYTYLKTTFNYPVIGEFEQKVSAFHYGFGFGITL